MEHNIKEATPLPDSGEPATHPEESGTNLPAVRKKNKIQTLIKEMWPAYLIEILVIILGISITLALEEWRDAGKEDKLERIYLNNLVTDLTQDQQSLQYATTGTRRIIDRGNELLTAVKNPGNDIPLSQFETDVRTILGRPKFISNDASFSDLKSSGNLHLLKDIRLKNILFAYYNQSQIIKEAQDAEQQATIILSGSYFLKLFPMNDPSDQPAGSSLGSLPTAPFVSSHEHGVSPGPGSNTLTDLSKNIEFANNVLLRVSTRKELLDLYQRADSLAIRVKDELMRSQ